MSAVAVAQRASTATELISGQRGNWSSMSRGKVQNNRLISTDLTPLQRGKDKERANERFAGHIISMQMLL